jgi:predicted dehydrogenase
MTGRVVRTGLIGCGNIGPTHAAALAALPESEFVAICDMDEGRARKLAADYDVLRVFTDMHELFRSGAVDAICVCTPHPSHAAIVSAAAEAGVHVLCEKPISASLADADAMIEAADRAGITFGVIFQRRFWPAAQRIRRAIDEGRLGKLTLGECTVLIWRSPEYFGSAAWRGKWATEGGGVLMNQAVHAIDQFQWFLGPAVEVYGRYATQRHGDVIDVEDTAVATVVFANGALGANTAASTVDPGFGFRVAVHGDNGATASVWENPEGVEGINDVWTVPGPDDEHAAVAAQEPGHPGFPGFHQQQIQDFLQAILDGRPPAVTGAEGRKALELILAIYESSRTGKPVTLPLTTG